MGAGWDEEGGGQEAQTGRDFEPKIWTDLSPTSFSRCMMLRLSPS